MAPLHHVEMIRDTIMTYSVGLIANKSQMNQVNKGVA